MYTVSWYQDRLLEAEEAENKGQYAIARRSYYRVIRAARYQILRGTRKFYFPFGMISSGLLIWATGIIPGALIGAGVWYLGKKAAESLSHFELQDIIIRAENGVDRCIKDQK